MNLGFCMYIATATGMAIVQKILALCNILNGIHGSKLSQSH